MSHPINRLPALRTSTRPPRGFTLVELMVSMTIGLLVLAALLAVFLNVSRTNREMARSNILLENGRFAIQLLENDLIHAGYWGELDFLTDPAPTYAKPNSIPDPCLGPAAWDSAYQKNILNIAVQGFTNSAPPSCISNVLAGSDVLFIRHASTCIYGDTACDEGTDRGPHIQISNCHTETSPEAAYVIASTGTTPSATDFPLRQKNCPATPVTTINAPLRKVVSHFYYIATSGGQPTLMRVSMENGAYSTPQPLVDGIEQFRVEYGIDENGKNGLPITATNPGDGSADRFTSTADLAAAPNTSCDTAGSRCNLLANTVAVKIYILARNLETSPGYTDNKTYQLGSVTVAAANDQFKRHLFTSTIRLVNPSGRRDAP